MNSFEKYYEDEDNHIFWEQSPHFKKFNNSLTLISALDIINRLSLHCEDKSLLEEVDVLKEWIKSKQ